jgi:hypothetical protein
MVIQDAGLPPSALSEERTEAQGDRYRLLAGCVAILATLADPLDHAIEDNESPDATGIVKIVSTPLVRIYHSQEWNPMNMIELQESDFRSPDPRLVHVLPGREMEATQYAQDLFALGKCDGIFVQNRDIKDWCFLVNADGLKAYVFSNIDVTFKRVDHNFMHAAQRLSISEIRCALDLSRFPALRALGLWWSPHCKNLERLEALRNVSLWGIGKTFNAQLDLAESVRHVELVRYGLPTLSFGERAMHLTELNIYQARALQSLPPMEEVRSIDLKFVGSQIFDYASIPDSVEFLEIDACAPIPSFDFLAGKTQLRSLVIRRTPCPTPSRAELDLLSFISCVRIPHHKEQDADLTAEWRQIMASRQWNAHS